MAKMEEKQYRYFFSYAFTMKDRRSGFGSCMMELDGKIENMDDIKKLEECISEDIGGSCSVVILNYQIME